MKTLKGNKIEDGVRLMGRGAEEIKWPLHFEVYHLHYEVLLCIFSIRSPSPPFFRFKDWAIVVFTLSQPIEAQAENAKQQAIPLTLKSQVTSVEAHIHFDPRSLR